MELLGLFLRQAGWERVGGVPHRSLHRHVGQVVRVFHDQALVRRVQVDIWNETMGQKEKGGEREGETEGAGYPFHTHLNQQRDSVASRRRKWQLAESRVGSAFWESNFRLSCLCKQERCDTGEQKEMQTKKKEQKRSCNLDFMVMSITEYKNQQTRPTSARGRRHQRTTGSKQSVYSEGESVGKDKVTHEQTGVELPRSEHEPGSGSDCLQEPR